MLTAAPVENRVEELYNLVSLIRLVAAVIIETELDRYDVPVRRRTSSGSVVIGG